MKVSCLLFALNGIFFFGAQDVKAQQQLLNGGFEETYIDSTTFFWESLIPVNWRFGMYIPTDGACPYMGALTNDSHSGEWAVELETLGCAPSSVAGSMWYSAENSGMIAPVINDRPDQLTFYYKFSPVGGDSARFSSLLFNFPDSLSLYDPGWFEAIDTVAYIKDFIPDASDQYIQRISNFNYLSDDVPEYITVSFSSNKQEYYGHAGTTLWIDDVELIYLNTSISEWSDSHINIFPNPVSDRFQLNQAGDVKAERMELLNHVGQSVGTLNPQDRFHAVDHLPPGMYFLQIETEKGVVVKKLVKE